MNPSTSGSGSPGGPLAAALAHQEDRLSNCVHCGFCLPACPTYTRLGDEADSPRGRLHLMGAVVEGRLSPSSDAYQRHLDRCLGCRACESVCPSGVEYGLLLERAREMAVAARPPSLLSRLLLAAVERRWLFLPWMWASRLLRASGLPALAVRWLPAASGDDEAAPDGTMRERLRLGAAMLAASAPVGMGRMGRGEGSAGDRRDTPEPEAPSGRVALLTGCIQDQLFARVNRATVRVLEVNGWEVLEVRGQGCCGALHAHGGRLREARRMARANVRAFRAALDGESDRIAANAAGCGATMREYPHLLEDGSEEDRELARWFARGVRDVSELLAGSDVRPRRGGMLPLRVAYDAPCHLLHGQGVAKAPLRLLEAIPGLELVPLSGSEECCGGAGIYGITHPSLGGWIGRDKVSAVRESGAQMVATGNPGCVMQIGAGLRMAGLTVDVVHPVELLDESYRRAGLYD